MAKVVTIQEKERMRKIFPFGDKWEKRMVIHTRMPDAWYKIGDIITVKYFATFGCYDENDRWVDYYDLSHPIKRQIGELEKQKLISEEIVRIENAKSELKEWDDIPMNWQYNSICKILGIKNDSAGREIVISLILPIDSMILAEKLYTCRGHEFTDPPIKKPWYKRLFKL